MHNLPEQAADPSPTLHSQSEGCSGAPIVTFTFSPDGKCHQGSPTLCSTLPGKPATCSYSTTMNGIIFDINGVYAGADCGGASVQPAAQLILGSCYPITPPYFIKFVLSGTRVDENVYTGAPSPPPAGPCPPKICGDCSKVGCTAPPCPPDWGQDCRCEEGFIWNDSAQSCEPLALLTCGELAIKAGAPWNLCSPDKNNGVDCITCKSERSCPSSPSSIDTDHCQCSVRQYLLFRPVSLWSETSQNVLFDSKSTYMHNMRAVA